MQNIAEQEKILSLTDNNRDLVAQGWAQIGSLVVTLVVSCVGGAISGLIASKVGAPVERLFDDECHFEEPPY